MYNNSNMSKSLARTQARALRASGLSIKEIVKKLHVSQSTASLWCRDIVLTPEQIRVLERNAHDPGYGLRHAYIQRLKQEKLDRIKRITDVAINEVGSLGNRELFLSGVSLYWAEGFKKDNQVGFSNSDPDLVTFFLLWLYSCCHVTPEMITLRVGLNESYRIKVKEIEKYWSDMLQIPLTQFQKPFFQKVKWKKTYDNPQDYHGVLRVRVRKSAELRLKILGWIEGLKMNGGKLIMPD